MFENKVFDNEEELKKAHQSEKFPGSNDVGMSTSVEGIGTIRVFRPKTSEDMYVLSFEDTDTGQNEEIAFIGGSTRIAEDEFAKISEFMKSRKWESWEEAKPAVRAYIVELHGGLAK